MLLTIFNVIIPLTVLADMSNRRDYNAVLQEGVGDE